MAEPLRFKAGSTALPIAATLIGTDGNPIDLSGPTPPTVTVDVFSTVPPYTKIVDNAAVSISPTPGEVIYDWASGQTDVPGDYLAEFRVDDGRLMLVPGDDYLRISILPTTTFDGVPYVPLVSLGEVENAMGRFMTPAEAAQADQLVRVCTAQLSLWLNRDLVPTRHVDEKHVANDLFGINRLEFNHGPVTAVESVTYTGRDPTTTYNDWMVAILPTGSYTVTYVSGDEVPSEAVRGVLIQAVAGAILSGPAAATGAIKSYSVEGSSITYGEPGAVGGSVGRFAVADLTSIKRLKRRVIA